MEQNKTAIEMLELTSSKKADQLYTTIGGYQLFNEMGMTAFSCVMHPPLPLLLAILSDGYGKARLDGAQLLCIVKAKRDAEALKEAHLRGNQRTHWGKGR